MSGRHSKRCLRYSFSWTIIATHKQVDQWDFDPFELDRVTQGHPLVTLSAYLFSTKYNFFSRFAFSKVYSSTFPRPRATLFSRFAQSKVQ